MLIMHPTCMKKNTISFANRIMCFISSFYIAHESHIHLSHDNVRHVLSDGLTIVIYTIYFISKDRCLKVTKVAFRAILNKFRTHARPLRHVSRAHCRL